MSLFGCLAAFVAMALAYLSSPNQRWLARPLGRAGKIAAAALACLALIAWIVGETTLPGIAAAVAALMAGAVALPYLLWLLRPAGERKPR
ncbi:hypothetical protein L2Y94_20920 [Luteibacter aegosomatis]|uniref:hypothetical protein n=1 Tax=Luteibacter aegosomatis TaxID=2911537 RepID=UPI001FFB557F|nr:hypothetical protein [Luteibacter aegosomatis]UPG85723.1 hypothetical protein L2Y94_20920 [Luteibacter aegosomatis]